LEEADFQDPAPLGRFRKYENTSVYSLGQKRQFKLERNKIFCVANAISVGGWNATVKFCFVSPCKGEECMRLTASALMILLLFAGASFAQNRGTITGTITDPTGAVVPSASVEAKNLDTGVAYQAASSQTGNYTISQLPVGKYQVTASKSGFKQYTQTGITVSTTQVLRIDLKLEVGNISEIITVSSEAPLLKRENAEISQVVTTDQMNEIPILTAGGFGIRNTYSAINLLPGAGELTPPGQFFNALRVNGLPAGTMAVRIDGQDATETTWSAAYNMAMPGQDSMVETSIQTSTYSAEFGQAGGGIFNMTMKSGTNRLHGGMYEYLRNDALNAAQPYNHVKATDKRHDYGFTLGGPVYIPKIYDGRDKTFFYFSFEQNREDLSLTSTYTVPTLAFRNGDLRSLLNTATVLGNDPAGNPIYQGQIFNPGAATTHTAADGSIYRDPFMGCDGKTMNVICLDPTSQFYANPDPTAMALQAAIPAPTNSGSTSNYTVTYPYGPLTTIPSVKIDHNLSSKLKLSGSWAMTDIQAPFPDGFKQPVTTERTLWETTHTARISLDYTITPTMLLHLGGGYMGFSFFDPVPNYQNYDPLTNLGLSGTFSKIPPYISGLTGADQSGMVAMGPASQARQLSQKPTGTANLTWVKGNHTYKFGADVRVESYPSLVVNPSNGQFTFNAAQTAEPYLLQTSIGSGNIGHPYASFLLGDVSSGVIGKPSNFHLGKHSLAFFAMDTWKATPKLTIDYGLRYDYETYLRTSGMYPAFGFNVPNSNYGNLLGAGTFEGFGPGKCNCNFASNYPYNFGPRVGLAYEFLPKTVIRVGAGVSYAQTASLEMHSLFMGSSINYGPATQYGMPISQLHEGSPFPVIYPNYDPGQIPATPGSGANAFDRHAGYPPRMLMWSIGIQRELSKDMSLEISYVGNRGYWWNSEGVLTDPNRVTPAILSAHNFDPTLANVTDDFVLLQQFNTLTPDQTAHYKLKAPYAGFQGTVTQSLRPYPHFGGITVYWAPLGKTWYDSLQAKFTKRYSHGLSMTANYTFQKEMVLGTESASPVFQVASPIINLDNIRVNKSLSGLSTPHRLVIAGNYITPKVNVYKPLSILMKDWNIGAYLVYASGFPIMAPFATNYPNPYQLLSLSGANVQSWFGIVSGASFMSRVQGQPLFAADANSRYDPFTQTVLNSAAWANPAPGQFGLGTPYHNDYRYRRIPNENMSLARNINFKEGVSLQIRAELNNVFNRTRIPNPFSQIATMPFFGSSNLGWAPLANTTGQRTGQIVMRLSF
jgi:hypothetical protein